MRWFVEVSSIGDTATPRSLCIEAMHWQSALQEGRRLVGDSSALSAFSIEVLDDGYRAVSAEFRLCYVVRRAPDHAALSEGASSSSLSSVPPGPMLLQSRQNLTTVPAPPSDVPAAVTVPDDQVPDAPPAPAPTPSQTPVSAPRAASSGTPNASAVGSALDLDGDDALAQTVPQSLLIHERLQEPSAESPVVYREAAYAVRPGLGRDGVERALLARFQQIYAELERRPAGKYVQIAIFDHGFDERPLRPPLATLSFKDWRGAPVVAFPAFGESMPPSSPEPSARTSSRPPSVELRALSSIPAGMPGADAPPDFPEAPALPALASLETPPGEAPDAPAPSSRRSD